tara:strand:+ start:176 stop:571 length:396 start_codon:yes stop_codon:yes gene_type:complete
MDHWVGYIIAKSSHGKLADLRKCSIKRLVTLKIWDHNTKRAKGKRTLILRGTQSDPLHEIPLLSIGEFSYVSGVTDYTVIEEKPLGVGDAYLPYLIGPHYDDLRVFKVGTSFDQPDQLEEETFKVQCLTSS